MFEYDYFVVLLLWVSLVLKHLCKERSRLTFIGRVVFKVSFSYSFSSSNIRGKSPLRWVLGLSYTAQNHNLANLILLARRKLRFPLGGQSQSRELIKLVLLPPKARVLSHLNSRIQKVHVKPGEGINRLKKHG